MAAKNELGSNVQAADNEVEATDLGGGWWQITAPWLEAPEKIQGEEEAKARVAQLIADAEDNGADEQPAGEDDLTGIPRKFTKKLNKKEKKAVGLDKVRTKRIYLEENEEIPPGGLYIGHNGRGYMILPGHEVDVPVFLLEILDNAVKQVPVVDPNTKRVVGWRTQRRYPYRTA